MPEVLAPVGLERWLGEPGRPGVVRLMLDPASPRTLNDLTPPLAGGAREVLIGAEGGLAPEESRLAELAGFVSVRLGPRILRTETAGLAVLSALNTLIGDF